jgi:hydroxymethylpyrimidine pyrophosphatase-like HAD family hydrolase
VIVALDLDGTTLREDGSVSDAVIEQVRRLDTAGRHVVLTTATVHVSFRGSFSSGGTFHLPS